MPDKRPDVFHRDSLRLCAASIRRVLSGWRLGEFTSVLRWLVLLPQRLCVGLCLPQGRRCFLKTPCRRLLFLEGATACVYQLGALHLYLLTINDDGFEVVSWLRCGLLGRLLRLLLFFLLAILGGRFLRLLRLLFCLLWKNLTRFLIERVHVLLVSGVNLLSDLG